MNDETPAELVGQGAVAHDAVAAALRCAEAFTERFNARDAAGMDALLHFPHAILTGERLTVWDGPGRLAPDYFDKLAAEGWRRSTYLSREPVLASRRKVHLAIAYTRDGADGAPLSRHQGIWVITFEDGRWGVRVRC